MNLSLIRTNIESWINSVTNSTFSLFWKNRPRTYRQNFILLRLKTPTKQGFDSVVSVYDGTAPSGQEITPTVKGNREIILEITINCYSASNNLDALHYLNLLHDSLSLYESVDLFRSCGIAYKETLMSDELDLTDDSREMSIAQLDLAFNADALKAGTATTYVEHYGVKSEYIYDTNGSIGPTQIDLNT